MKHQDSDMQPTSRAETRKQRSPRRHLGRKIFGVVLLLLIIVAAAFGFTAWHNLSITTGKMYDSAGANHQRNPQTVLRQKRPVSILLLGTDTGALGRSYKGRTDTIMVMTINPRTKSTTLVSIPRDMKVNLPNDSEDSPCKINAAYAFGGTKMTINTVQKYYDIPVDYYVLVNMGGLKKCITHVGGVDVTSPLTFDYEGYHFTQGKTYHMDGADALAFCRMRYDDPQGDYGRQARQRMIINALLKKSISYKTVLNPAFLNSLGSSMKTDLTFADMRTLALRYRSSTKRISSDRAKVHSENIDGQAYEVVSQSERNRVSNELQQSLDLQ